jgi:hypothetical protein
VRTRIEENAMFKQLIIACAASLACGGASAQAFPSMREAKIKID